MGRRREGLLLPGVVVVACVAVAVAWALREREALRARVEREDAALAAVLLVASAERAHREATGVHGWIDELASAGRLPGLSVETLDGRAVVRTPGYRVEVLLPRNEARIVPAGGPEPDPALRAAHFAVVARPLAPGVDGFRTWYLDERGDVFALEGAVDPEALRRNELPDWPVGLVGADAAGRLGEWQKVP
jgi:hypothetical protein